MKALFDFFPVVAFFAVYIIFGKDIYLATEVLMAAMVVQVSILWIMHRKVSRMHVVSAVLVWIFGLATLLLRNDMFIKWKPTVANWLFAAFFLGSQMFTPKSIIQRMLESNFTLEAAAWQRLNMSWAVFFIVLGALNLFVVYSFSEEVWVNFKLFGLLGLTLVFSLAQAMWLVRKLPPQEKT